MLEYIQSLNDFIQFDFLQRALIGTLLLSLCSGILSPFIVAKKYAFIGSAVSHSTLLGLSLTIGVLGLSTPYAIFLTLLAITLMLNLFLAYSTYKDRIPADSLIGIFFTATMGLGIIIHGLVGKNSSELVSYLFGNILLIDNGDLLISSILLIIVSLSIFPLFKKWIYTTFDPEGAQVSGVSTKAFHYGFFLLITLVIVSAVKLSGTVLINTLLIMPGVFALKMGRNIKSVFVYSILFCLFTSTFGLSIANFFDQPSGATMTVIQFAVLGVFYLYRKVSKA